MIYIRELKVETIIGTKAWERQVKQQIWLDLEFSYDMQQAVADDNIAHAVDYTSVAEASINFVTAQSFQLIEALAHKLADYLLQLFPLQSLKIRVTRPGVLAQAKEVGVTIEREQHESL